MELYNKKACFWRKSLDPKDEKLKIMLPFWGISKARLRTPTLSHLHFTLYRVFNIGHWRSHAHSNPHLDHHSGN